jgi:hypothetical protein
MFGNTMCSNKLYMDHGCCNTSVIQILSSKEYLDIFSKRSISQELDFCFLSRVLAFSIIVPSSFRAPSQSPILCKFSRRALDRKQSVFVFLFSSSTGLGAPVSSNHDPGRRASHALHHGSGNLDKVWTICLRMRVSVLSLRKGSKSGDPARISKIKHDNTYHQNMSYLERKDMDSQLWSSQAFPSSALVYRICYLQTSFRYIISTMVVMIVISHSISLHKQIESKVSWYIVTWCPSNFIWNRIGLLIRGPVQPKVSTDWMYC